MSEFENIFSEVIKLPAKYEKLTSFQRRDVRERYIEQQNGLCMHCGNSLDDEPTIETTDKPIDWSLFPKDFRKYPVHLQHDHTTGMTEGSVHAYCNAVLWQHHGR